jgi:hypothetical protein
MKQKIQEKIIKLDAQTQEIINDFSSILSEFSLYVKTDKELRFLRELKAIKKRMEEL